MSSKPSPAAWGIGTIVVILIVVVVIAFIGGPVKSFFTATWWVWIVLPCLGAFAYLMRGMVIHRRRMLPPLDRTPRTGIVVEHRLWGDHSDNRSTAVEYRTADGELQTATLADEIAEQSVELLPVGSTVEVYAYRDPQYARTVVFLTEKHDDVWRKGVSSLWGWDSNEGRFPEPAPGSPFFGPDTAYRFAESDPVASEGDSDGATPRYEQKETRILIAYTVVPVLVGLAVIGVGRFTWWSTITSTQASSGIGIGVDYDTDAGDDSNREIIFVPYKLDGLPAYQARIAAISLADGTLLWDRKLDSDVWERYPVAVTSFDRPVEGGTDRTVVVTTERGAFGFDPSWGDLDCGPGTSTGDCSIESGQGTLANIGELLGEGTDLYGDSPNGVDLTEIDGMVGITSERFDTVLDPATGEPAGDGFRVEYYDTVRVIVDDRVVAELADVTSLQQVLVAPSGKVVLLMRGENRKSVLVIATEDGLRRVTIGDRGLVAWPAWMG